MKFLATSFAACLVAISAVAAPPDYQSFHREQSVSYHPNDQDLMRIWVVYVDQGDSILVQMPKSLNYDPDPTDSENSLTEFVDVLVDSGSSPESESRRALEFIQTLYPTGSVIEHVFLTHHDFDHVAGLIRILAEPDIGIESIYHNGLASYRPGVLEFPSDHPPQKPAIYVKNRDGKPTKWMGFLDPDNNLQDKFIIDNLSELKTVSDDGYLQGVYGKFTNAVIKKDEPFGVKTFTRINQSSPEIGFGTTGPKLEFLWPPQDLKKYGDWGKTINGNSLVFRLAYGDFEMLFTGDLNEEAQEVLLDDLGEVNTLLLNCDVLKIPHHGSAHSLEPFLKHPDLDPVISVASMGAKGFKSKQLNDNRSNWQHPSTEVIGWLGGSHRVYQTYIHEKRFKWEDLVTIEDHQKMEEKTHILIETDGRWFRVVETDNPYVIPSVNQTRRGNGTRWINARQ